MDTHAQVEAPKFINQLSKRPVKADSKFEYEEANSKRLHESRKSKFAGKEEVSD